MSYTDGLDPICEEIANALGFSEVTSLSLDIGVHDAVSVTVTKYVTKDELVAVAEVLSRYKIEATPIGVSTE